MDFLENHSRDAKREDLELGSEEVTLGMVISIRIQWEMVVSRICLLENLSPLSTF